MKKILLIIICSFCLQFGKAQTKFYVPDSSLRAYFKKMCTGYYSSQGYSCPACFVGDSLVTSSFTSYTSDINNIDYFSSNLNNLGMTSLQGFQFFGWGGFNQTYGCNNISSFSCDSNYITTLLPISQNSNSGIYR